MRQFIHKKQTALILAILGGLWLVYAAIAVLKVSWLGDIVSPLLSWIPVFILFAAARKSKQYALTWIMLAIGVVSWAVAETVWGIQTLALGLDPSQSVILLYLYLMTNFGILCGVAYIALRERRRWMSIPFVVDIVGIFVSLCAFVYFAFIQDRLFSLALTDHEAITTFVALLTDMCILSFGMSVYLSLNPKKIPFYFSLVFSAVVLYACADILYAYSVFNDTYLPNEAVDVLYALSIALLGSGGVLFLDRQNALVSISAEVDSALGKFNRSLFLLLVPALCLIVRRLDLSGLAFFAAIILVHQVVSRLVGLLLRRDIALEHCDRQTEYLEAMIADRTRELKIMNQTLENLLKRDAITGLFNRKFFLETAEDWIASAKPDDRLWLLILDFDRFKTINDAYGHDAGDFVLRVVAKRLEAIVGDGTVIARLGGDEFGVACMRKEGETITALLHSITEMVTEPVQVAHNTVHTSLSIGVACWPDDALNRSDLMRHADIAMYVAKRRRVNGISFFDNALIAGIERTHQIDLALKAADFEREFSLVYQPQFATGGRRLVGLEALVRWNSPSLGFIPPDEFISVAEENGVINPLSDWIMRKALERIADWNGRYERNLLMGINVSPHQLDEPTFLSKLERFIAESGARPEWVNLEFTERVAMKGEAFIVEIFGALSRLNVVSSIDDFGTGYSSLSYIKKFHIDYLKIAKQLVDNIVANETDARIVQAIIMMATALNVRTIAEGVEAEEQLTILEQLGCDEIQGYLLGKPCPPAEFEERFLNADEPDFLEGED